MSRPGYLNFYITEEREVWLREVCDRLGLPHTHKMYGKAIDTSLAAMVAGMTETKGEDEMALDELLTKYKANFHYSDGLWCLSGTSADGNYYETDDYEADTQEEAEEAAIEYLIAYHQD